jgi:hypothetical protein
MGRGYWRGDAQARAGWLREMGSIPYRVVRSTFSERSAAPQLQGGRPTFRPLSRRSRARRPIVNIERSEMQTSLSAQFAPSTV